MYTKVAKKPLYYSPGKGFQNEDIWKFEFWNALVSVFTHLRGKQNQIFTFQLQIWIWLVFFDVEYTIQMHRLEAKAYLLLLLFLCCLVCFVACSRVNFEIYVKQTAHVLLWFTVCITIKKWKGSPKKCSHLKVIVSYISKKCRVMSRKYLKL